MAAEEELHLIGPDEVAFRLDLTPGQLKIVHTALHSLLDGLGHDEHDVQDIVRRHVEWLSITMNPTKEYVIGLGEMYVADPRFTANYDRHGPGTAEYVRDAMKVYAERNL